MLLNRVMRELQFAISSLMQSNYLLSRFWLQLIIEKMN